MRKKYSLISKDTSLPILNESIEVNHHTENLESNTLDNNLLYAHHQQQHHHHPLQQEQVQTSDTEHSTGNIHQEYYYITQPNSQQHQQEETQIPPPQQQQQQQHHHHHPHQSNLQFQESSPPSSSSTTPFIPYQSTTDYHHSTIPCTITDDPGLNTSLNVSTTEVTTSAVASNLHTHHPQQQQYTTSTPTPTVGKSKATTITSGGTGGSSRSCVGAAAATTSSSSNPATSLAMSQLGTVYATKRRRRNGKSLKPPPKDGVTKSNPSKRHRERLNAELDLLASLLPFEQNILSKLDRLSILRLSVSYLRTKSYFQVVMHKEKEENNLLSHIHSHDGYRTRELGAFEHGLLDGDMFLQALNGFLMILTCEGEVFFATHSIESYLGFHQSDIVHQSVYELVHSEDREELQRQLLWNSFLPADLSGMPLAEALAPDKNLYLERSFTVRFRCLLDNTSGFLRLDIRGRIKILHGQNRKTEEPPLALFAYCTPFGPPSLLEIPQKENMFKSKHKLDLSLVSMDQRGKIILGYSDSELVNMGGYDLVHYDDLAYVASAHQELLKTGASGMIAYRYQKKDGEWQWLQTSSRLVYKNSKPDFVICTHRQLMEEEGRDLLGKRTMDFKVSYLDTGLASTYFSEADQLVVAPTGSPTSLPPPITPQRTSRRYKSQLRDFLSTCRSKRKLQQSSPLGQVTPPAPVVEYIPDPAAAVAAAYSNLNPMYTASPYASAADNIYMTPSVHSTNFYPVTENLFHQYRLQGVGGYYPEYHHTSAPTSYVANGFLSYEGYGIPTKDDKWQDSSKYYSGAEISSRSVYTGYSSPTSNPQVVQIPLKTPKSSPQIMEVVSCSSGGPSPVNSTSSIAMNTTPNHINPTNTSANNVNSNTSNGSANVVSVTPKIEHSPPEHYERQTVLMWGTTSSGGNGGNAVTDGTTPSINPANRSPNNTPTSNGLYNDAQHIKVDENSRQHPVQHVNHLKWNGTVKDTVPIAVSEVQVYNIHQQHSSDAVDASSIYSAHNVTSHHPSGGHITTGTDQSHHQSPHSHPDILMQSAAVNHQNNVGGHHQHQHLLHSQSPQQQTHTHHQTVGSNSGCEVWSPASYSQYQYFTYHHAPQHASTQSSLGLDSSQSHYLSRSNGYMDAHHPAHHHHPYHPHHPSQSHHPHHPSGGTISPISPLTQLSHTHPTRTPITRTGVLCCPSLR